MPVGVVTMRNWSFMPQALLIGVLRAYQRMISPALPSACKFYPTCSEYACQAVERYGAAQGSWMAIRRLVRCRPFSPGGYDPVPSK